VARGCRNNSTNRERVAQGKRGKEKVEERTNESNCTVFRRKDAGRKRTFGYGRKRPLKKIKKGGREQSKRLGASYGTVLYRGRTGRECEDTRARLHTKFIRGWAPGERQSYNSQ